MKIKHTYLITILTIFGIIVAVNLAFNAYLKESENDADIINLSGKQRMISQRIVWKAMQFQRSALGHKNTQTQLQDIAFLLSQFKKVHVGLQTGNKKMQLAKLSNPEIKHLFRRVNPHFRTFVGAVENLIDTQNSNNLDQQINTILRSQNNYLKLQDEITNRFGWEAKNKQNNLGTTLLVLSVISGAVLVMELLFVFRPTIRKLRQTNSALEATSGKYRFLYNKTPAMLHSIDNEGNLLMVSDYWLKVMGYSRGEVIGKPSVSFLTEASKKYAREKILPDFFKSGTCHNVPYQFVRKDGSVIDVSLSAILEKDENGAPSKSVAVITDVTEQVRNRKELEKSYQELLHVDRITQASLQNQPLEDLIQLTMNAYEGMSDSNGNRFYLYDQSQNQLKLIKQKVTDGLLQKVKSMTGINVDSVVPKIDPGNVFHQVLQDGKVLVFTRREDILNILEQHTDNPILQKLASLTLKLVNIQGIALIPLVGKDKKFGLVSLTFNSEPSQNIIERLERFTLSINSALDKAYSQREIKRLAEIVKYSNDAIVSFSLDKTIISWNRGATNIFGYSSEEMVGKTSEWFQPKEQVDAFHRLLEKIISTGDSVSTETMWQTKSGGAIHVSLSLFPIRNEQNEVKEVSGIIRDISERKETEIALIRNEASLKEAQKIGKLGSWEWDVLSNKTKWSDEMFNIFGASRTKTDISFEEYLEFVHDDDRDAIKLSVRQALEKKKPFALTHRILCKDQVKYIECKGRVEQNDMGEIVRLHGIAMDITHNKELEQAKERFTRQLEEKVEERTKALSESQKLLETSLKREKELGELRSHFVSVASHQFRTPMTIIQSNSELIEMMLPKIDPTLHHKFDKVTSRIKQEVSKMTDLMDDVLVLGKIRAENSDVALSEVDLSQVCQELMERFNSIQKDGRKLRFTEIGNPVKLMLNEKMIGHALANLISNAFKYSPDTKDPEMVLEYGTEEVTLSIRDHGIGIPESALDTVFQPFYRAKNTEGFKGTGLGLSIAKEYVESSNGTLCAESQVGKGTVMTITFLKTKEENA